MKENKGVTLIVLIVTIIVLIILAVVAIDIAIEEEGVISRSESIRTENSRVQFLDQIKNATKTSINEFGDYEQDKAIDNIIKICDQSKIKEIIIETNGRLGITFKEKNDEFKYIVSNKGEVLIVSKYIYEKENEDYEIKSIIDNEEKNAYDLLVPVPFGFELSIDGNEKKATRGLVICEKDGTDKYVWIPVKEEDLNSSLVDDENGDIYYSELLKINEKEYKILEPYYTDNGSATVNDSVVEAKEFKMILRKNFDNVIKSIKNNGGFYISKEKLTLDNGRWFNYWNRQKELKDKYSTKQEIFTDMIYGFQVKMIEKFLAETGENNNLGYLKDISIGTQSTVLNVGEKVDYNFEYASLRLDSNYGDDINNIKRNKDELVDGFFTTLYFE